jgi:hypothetical protein
VDEFRTILKAEFDPDIAPVRVHGFDAEVKCFGNIMTVPPLPDQTQDFELSITQLAHDRPAVLGGRAREVVEDPG